VGTVSTAYFKDPGDPVWANDPGYRDWAAFMDRYFPGGSRMHSETVYGYLAAQTLVEVLKRCGDDLTRDNIMKQAASLKGLELGMLLPGITISTGPNDYAPIKQMKMQRFNGYEWELFGPAPQEVARDPVTRIRSGSAAAPSRLSPSDALSTHRSIEARTLSQSQSAESSAGAVAAPQ
jgi:hypothetical protein